MAQKVKIDESWYKALKEEFEAPYFDEIINQVRRAYTTSTCYPPAPLIFNAFDLTPLPQVKVVILGQDPYHGTGQAMGMSFSVAPQCPLPPSLQNIYKELSSDLELPPPHSGDLTSWARQGVLLLNSALTVEAHKPMSHKYIRWDKFTDQVIKVISQEQSHVVFILWGSDAQRKEYLIDQEKHLVLKSPHPSPLSAYRGFFGCKHFSQTNYFLIQKGIAPIQWI